MNNEQQQLLINDWVVNFQSDTIECNGNVEKIDHKVMQLLWYLANHPSQTLTRDQLLDAVWKDQVVADDVLSVAVSSLRKILGDNTKEPKYIKTIPRKGYMFIASVSPVINKKVETYSKKQSNNQHKVLWLIAGILIFISIYATQFFGNKNNPIKHNDNVSIAVLPFDYFSSMANKEYIADGLTEAIINQLVQQPNLLVTSRTSVMNFKQDKPAIKEIAEQLHVDWVLEGSVQIENDTLLVTAQLINAESDKHIWSETYQRQLSDLFEIQLDIADKIRQRFLVNQNNENSAEKSNRQRAKQTVSAEAYDVFLQARFFAVNGESEKANQAYLKAIKLAPDYADALAGLSLSYYAQAYFSGGDISVFDLANQYAKKAVSIGYQTADVHLADALFHFFNINNFQKAGELFAKSFALNRQDMLIQEWYIQYLIATKQFDLAVQVTNNMMQVSPLAYNKTTRYLIHYYAGEYELAASEIKKRSKFLSEGFQQAAYVWIYLASANQQGFELHAVAFISAFKVAEPEIKKFKLLLQNGSQKEAVEFILHGLPSLDDYSKAELYAWVGETDLAIELLNEMLLSRNMRLLNIAAEPAFQSLHKAPKFVQLIDKLNLGGVLIK